MARHAAIIRKDKSGFSVTLAHFLMDFGFPRLATKCCNCFLLRTTRSNIFFCRRRLRLELSTHGAAYNVFWHLGAFITLMFKAVEPTLRNILFLSTECRQS